MVDSPVGQVQVSATDNAHIGAERLFVNRMGEPALVWRQMEQGGVLVSEPLAYRLNLPRSGGAIRLYTDVGEHSFPVVGIYYDYSSNEGMLMMTMDVYHRYWHDNAVTAIALRLAPGVNVESTTRALQEGLSRQQSLIIRANQTLRNDVLAVFDRTFAITGALQVLATIVAFIGVLSALMTLQLEKQREAGILRAIGLTARQLWGLVMLESGLMGAAAGLLAVPTGYALCLILVYIINRRSFGWTLQLALTPEPFLQAFGVALAAALLAGILPAYRFSRQQIAETIRYE
jgi:putative ABC transport system permease protein